MQTIIKGFQSRTVWMALAMFIVAGTNGISGLIPDGYLGFVEAFMTFLTMYFKLNPSQNYN